MDEDAQSGASGLRLPGGRRRRAVSSAPEGMVETSPLFPDQSLPLLVTARVPELDLAGWASAARDMIEEGLLRHGGLLFRGFGSRTARDLESFIHALSGEALEYRERSSPRSAVEGRIYTSTDYPPDQPIFFHNENSYQSAWPLKIFFMCQQPAEHGGETPIVDCRRILARIDPPVRDRFLAKGWMYVRNFGGGVGLDWQTVFQTADRAAVERHCRDSGIEMEWTSGNRLRTRAVRPAVARHPKTGEPLWFNHATFFHLSTLGQQVRSALLAAFAEDELPANTYYGDGSPIESEALDQLRALYRDEAVSFAWRRGDVLLVDNMMVAHGRNPFRGERRIVVGMAEPVSREPAAG
jgi:alpha-ketoglutarate-dependent taurine dioxygenase